MECPLKECRCREVAVSGGLTVFPKRDVITVVRLVNKS